MLKKYHNYLNNGIGLIFSLISQMVLISFINRTFGLEFSGFFSMIMAILGQVYIFFNFRLKYFIATEHTNNIDFIDFFLFRFITSTTIFLLSLIGFVLIKEKFYLIYFFVLTTKFFESLSDLISGFFQRELNFKYLAIVTTIRSTIIILFIYLFSKSHNYLVIFKLIILVYLVFFLIDYYFISKILKSRKNFSTKRFSFKEIFKINFKNGLYSSIVSLRPNLFRFFLGFYGLEILGIYNTINYLNIGYTYLNYIIGEVADVHIARREVHFKKYLLIYSILGVVYFTLIILFLTLFQEVIFSFLFGNKLALGSEIVIIILFWGLIFNISNSIQNNFFINRNLNYLLRINLWEIITILISFLFAFYYLKQNFFNLIIIQLIISVLFLYYYYKSNLKIND